MSAHTGRLKVGSPANWNIYTEEGFWTGTTTRIGHAGPANAAEIVRRWNGYENLPAVLRSLAYSLSSGAVSRKAAAGELRDEADAIERATSGAEEAT